MVTGSKVGQLRAPNGLALPAVVWCWLEATVGLEPTHEGFAGPGPGDSDPHTPLAGFRVRVLVFEYAWQDETLDRLLGPGNGHKILCVRRTGYIGPGRKSREADE